MDVSIDIPELNVTATYADIIDTHIDVPNMMLTMLVGLFTESGDKLKTFTVDRQLTGFPIPTLEEQWGFVAPVLQRYIDGQIQV